MLPYDHAEARYVVAKDRESGRQYRDRVTGVILWRSFGLLHGAEGNFGDTYSGGRYSL